MNKPICNCCNGADASGTQTSVAGGKFALEAQPRKAGDRQAAPQNAALELDGIGGEAGGRAVAESGEFVLRVDRRAAASRFGTVMG